jgi:hypothetical protein
VTDVVWQIVALMVQLQRERTETARVCAALGAPIRLPVSPLSLCVCVCACVSAHSNLFLSSVSRFSHRFVRACSDITWFPAEAPTNTTRYKALGGADPTLEELTQRAQLLEGRLNMKEVYIRLSVSFSLLVRLSRFESDGCAGAPAGEEATAGPGHGPH